MSAQKLITEHLDLWTGAISSRSSSGRGSNSKIELAGIKALRDLILELALSGKLVAPHHGDESAHELLSHIKAEKSRSSANGIIRTNKVPEDSISSPPHCIPGHWCWARLGDVTNYGTTDKAEPNQVANDTWVLELEDIEKETSKLLKKIRYKERQFKSSKNRFECGDVLYGKLRPYLDKVLVADEPGVCTTEIIPIRGHQGLLSEFLRLALKSPNFRRYANDSTHGMNLPRLGTDKARMAIIPIAPTAEQLRIVQKVDELMALCDRLEQQTSDQLEAHETLVDTLLGTLTQSENATDLADNWALLATHFDTLFTTEQSIDKLKQTILQLAVMGRLVEQDATGKDALEVLRDISNEKLMLAVEGKAKKPKKSPSISDSEKRFALPKRWAWARLEDVFINIVDCPHSTPKFVGQGKLCIDTNSFKEGKLNHNRLRYVAESTFNERNSRLVPEGNDIIFAREGSVGESFVIPDNLDCCLGQRVMLFRPSRFTDPHFLRLTLSNPLALEILLSMHKGIGAKHVNVSDMRNYVIALPPEEEQRRITKKVDELIFVCDQLKGYLNQASEIRCQLADAIIEGALH